MSKLRRQHSSSTSSVVEPKNLYDLKQKTGNLYESIAIIAKRANQINISVKEDEHFLKAVRLAADSGISIVPVVTEDNELLGTVAYNDLLKFSSEFLSLSEPGGLIVLEMESNQYSFNEISKLVETNDAQITQLNTSTDPETGITQVTIRINKSEISDIVASLQRYDYNVKYYFGEELYENELRVNYDNLMNYLKL